MPEPPRYGTRIISNAYTPLEAIIGNAHFKGSEIVSDGSEMVKES